MGWDIVALGTHHKLPINNPIEVAQRLLPLCDGPLSIGYFIEWIFDERCKRIYQPEGMYKWIEIESLNSGSIGKKTRFVIVDKCAQDIYSKVKSIIDKIRFDSDEDRDWFINGAYAERFSIYEFENDQFRPCNRIFKENVEMTVAFSGRWSTFVDMFKHPCIGEIKDYLDDFRAYIFKQATLCGCDTVYYFPDQGYGDLLYDKIDLQSDKWLKYMYSAHCKQEWLNSSSKKLMFVNMEDYISGRICLGEHDDIDVIIDDFSDLK